MSVLVVRDQRASVLALQHATPPALEWVNVGEARECIDEVDAALDPVSPERDRPAAYLAQIPTPQLRINNPAFALNVFFMGFWFMSKKMRVALNLADADVVIREVKIVGGSPRLLAFGYAAIAPVHHGDGIDPDRSDIEHYGQNRALGGYWDLATFGNVLPRVALRSGFSPPAPLFYMDRTDWLMITSEAAERVRLVGIEDVMFDEPVPAYGSWMTSRIYSALQ